MSHIAVPELRRYAPDALRMVGIPLGQADETADMLVWTEATVGGAVRFLRVHRARLLWVPRPRIRVLHSDTELVTLDARGGSLVEHGVRISDFVTAEAVAHGRRRVRVHNVYGRVFLPYVVARAADHGVAVTAIFEGRVEPTSDPALEPRMDLVLEAELDADAGRHGVNGSADYHAAVERGIDLAHDDFASLLQLFEMLRVPTSDRSRSHAG
jgi:hypothetical protein